MAQRVLPKALQKFSMAAVHESAKEGSELPADLPDGGGEGPSGGGALRLAGGPACVCFSCPCGESHVLARTFARPLFARLRCQARATPVAPPACAAGHPTVCGLPNRPRLSSRARASLMAALVDWAELEHAVLPGEAALDAWVGGPLGEGEKQERKRENKNTKERNRESNPFPPKRKSKTESKRERERTK